MGGASLNNSFVSGLHLAAKSNQMKLVVAVTHDFLP